MALDGRACRRSTTRRCRSSAPDLFKKSPFYRMYFHWPVLASRGCPHPCEYCTVQTYYDRTFRSRPVEEVIEDLKVIKSLGGRRVLILDDNPIGNIKYAKELFRAMIPLKMEWASQMTINIARNDELLDLAASSGCRSLSIGLESVSQDNLEEHRQGLQQGAALRRGPGEDPRQGHPGHRAHDGRARRRRHDQLRARRSTSWCENKLTFLKLFTPCPYPGTKYYDDMEKAGRILTKEWNRYDYGSPLIQPTHMTPDADDGRLQLRL